MQSTKIAKTRQLPSGAIEALSSNGHEVYQVRIGDRPSCTCPAGQNGRRCYHLVTAIARYSAFYAAPWARRRPANITDLYPEAA